MQIDLPETDKPRVVIVGGGFGGLELIKSLRKADVQVVLLDKNNYHTFQPLLYQVATSALEETSVAAPYRKVFQGQKNFYYRMAEVQRVIPEEKRLETTISDVHYDYLVIATGSRSNYFGNEGLIISSMPMKTIDQALDLRSMILQNFEKALVLSNPRKKQSHMNFVIAGGGPTGVELAGALGELKHHIFPKDYPELDLSQMNIYLVQSSDRLLPALRPKASRKAKAYLEQLGVTVLLNTRVQDYSGDYVQTNTDVDLTARTLIWTAGVIGAPIEGLDRAIGKGDRILVDDRNRVQGYEDIYAIGDVAAMISEDYPKGHPMMAPIAMQQGRHLGKNIKRALKGQDTLPFKYFDKGAMATVGKKKAVVNMPNFSIYGFLAWFVWLVVHLLYLVGFENKVVTVFHWTRNYFNSDRAVRLILNTGHSKKEKRRRKRKFYEEHRQKQEEGESSS
jgi:NADH dehydrogenase